MELNALTRWESLANDLSKLRVRRPVDGLDRRHHRLRTLQFFDDEFPHFGVEPSLIPGAKVDESKRKFLYLFRVLVRRAIRRFGKGFVIGSLIQALYVCSKLILSKSKRKIWDKQQPLKALGLVKIVQFGGFIGSFLTVFEIGMLLNQLYLSYRKSLDRSENIVISNESEAWATVDQAYDDILSASTAIVGGLAGLSLCLAPQSYRTPLAIFFGIRSLEIACKLLCEKGYLPSLPHTDILIMSISSSQVLYAWLFNRQALDSTYLGFLDYQSGKARAVCTAYRQAMAGEVLSDSNLEILNQYRSSEGLTPYTREMSACNILHPEHRKCFVAAGAFIINAMKRAIPVYVPVYFLPLFMFKTNKIVANPWHTVFHTGMGIVRSSTFLSSYCAVAWLSSCLQRHLGFHSTLTGYVAGLFAGATVALEKKPRRIEISLYVLSRALTSIHHSISRFLLSKSIAINIPQLDILCFAVATAVMCHTFVWRPDLLRPGYYLLLKWMIGSGVLNIPYNYGIESPSESQSDDD